MRNNSNFTTKRNRIPHLVKGYFFTDARHHLRVSRFDAEADTVAPCFAHQEQGFFINGIYTGKCAPGKAQSPTYNLLAHLFHPFGRGDKKVIGDINPVNAVGNDLLNLIDNQSGVSLSHDVSDHPASLAEDA